MVKAKQQRRRNRRKIDASNPPPFPSGQVSNVIHGTSECTVVFTTGVMIAPDALPQTWTFGTTPRHITSIVSATPTQYVFGLNGTVAAADPYVIGPYDPAARTTSGGYIAAGSGEMA